jgi:AcrR family transcriptional regulator
MAQRDRRWLSRSRDVKRRHMSWSSQGGFERRGYHHGNLREALVEAALALIATKGHAGFTIAEAARLAGVSPAAPYRHFRDADALLAEVALRGFERFTVALTAAWNDGRPLPVRAFEAVGLSVAADRAFGVLRKAAERLSDALPPGRRPPSLMVALHVWALSHGIASLFVRADPSRRKLPMLPEELLEAGVLLYLQSLGLAGGPM